VNGNLMM